MKNLILLLTLFIGISCTSGERENTSVKSFSINPETATNVHLSKIVNDVSFVKLESKKGSFIGRIEKIVFTKDRIFILDAYSSLKLFVYDLQGNFLFNIDNYGRGPGEFMGPYDFTINYDTGEIIIYDANEIKLSFYDINDGTFIEDKLLDFRFRRFESFNNQFVFYTDNRVNRQICCNIIITDNDLNIIDEKLKIEEEMRGVFFLMPMNFSRYKQNLFFTPHSDYTVYHFSNKNFNPYIKLDFGKYNAPEAYYKKYEDNDDRWEARGDGVYNVSNYMESENFSFFIYWINRTTYYYLSSRTGNQIFHTTNEKLIDDLNIGNLPRWPMGIHNNSLVWIQQPGDLLLYLNNKKEKMSEPEWKKFVNSNKELIEFAQSLSVEDNPFLIFTEIQIE